MIMVLSLLSAYEEEEMTALECRKQTLKCLEEGAYNNYVEISRQPPWQNNEEGKTSTHYLIFLNYCSVVYCSSVV